MGLIRRGFNYAQRLGGLGVGRQAPDVPLSVGTQSISSVPLLFKTGTRKDPKIVESHPLVNLFEAPKTMMSGSHDYANPKMTVNPPEAVVIMEK